jgi:hypothetical protein
MKVTGTIVKAAFLPSRDELVFEMRVRVSSTDANTRTATSAWCGQSAVITIQPPSAATTDGDADQDGRRDTGTPPVTGGE